MIVPRIGIFVSGLWLISVAAASGSDVPYFPSQGEPRLLVILVETPDQPAVLSAETIRRYFFSRANDGLISLAEYYEEVSYGRLRLRGEVTPWLRLSRASSEYAGGRYGRDVDRFPHNVGGFAVEALQAAAAAGISLAGFDHDGDRRLEGVMIIHSGPEAAATHNQNQLWSRLDYISMYDQGPLMIGGVEVDRFCMGPEYFFNPAVHVPRVWAHEFGHLLGLPDLYDSDNSSLGVGAVSLMGYPLPNDPKKIPVALDPYSKSLLGWISPREISGNTTVTLRPLAIFPDAVRLNTSVPGEYFLLSYQTAFESMARQFGDGLLLLHVNERAVYPNNYECRGRCELTPRLAVVQADGRDDLLQMKNVADPADLFPGPTARNTVAADTGSPDNPFLGAHTLTFRGIPSGIRIQDFRLSAPQAQARIILNDPAVPCRGLPCLETADRRWQEITGNGNGFPDPGEKLRLVITVINLGPAAQELSFSSASPAATFVKGEAKLRDLGPAETKEITFELTFPHSTKGKAAKALAGAFTDQPQSDRPSAENAVVSALPPAWTAEWFEPEIRVKVKKPAMETILKPRLPAGVPTLYIVNDAPHDLLPYCRWAADYLRLTFVGRDVLTEGLPPRQSLSACPLVLWLCGRRPLSGSEYPGGERMALFRSVIEAGHTLILSAGRMEENIHPALLELAGLKGILQGGGISSAFVVKSERADRVRLGFRYPYYPDITPRLLLAPAPKNRVLLEDLWGRPAAVIRLSSNPAPPPCIFLAFPYEALDRASAVQLLSAIIREAS